jgi:hypothetical protein
MRKNKHTLYIQTLARSDKRKPVQAMRRHASWHAGFLSGRGSTYYAIFVKPSFAAACFLGVIPAGVEVLRLQYGGRPHRL